MTFVRAPRRRLPGSSSRRCVLALALALAALATAPALASAVTPTCSAVLFLPVNGTGAYLVEQPEVAPGAIFCEPSVGSLSFEVAVAPAHGTLSPLDANGLGGASFDYTPAPGFAGADSFSLSAHDGADDPVTVQVQVQVRQASDDPPLCSAQLVADSDGSAYLVESGGPVAGSIDCYDDEGAELTFVVQAGPAHGALSSLSNEGDSAASFTYTPSPGYQGSDQFRLVANDGTQDSEPVVVNVAVGAAVNDPPSCVATLETTSDASGNFEIEQGETAHGTVTCVDEEGATLDLELAVPPSHGLLSPLVAADGGADLTYTPSPGYLGFDSFRVDASDGANPAVQVTVRVRVVAAHDDPPVCTARLLAPALNGAYRVGQGATVEGVLDCDDDEGAPLTYAVAAPPQHGSVTQVGTDGHFSYTASASYGGADQIALVANDGSQDSQPAVIAIVVEAVANQAPTCEVALGTGANASDEYSIERGTQTEGRIVCDDDDSDLVLTVATAPAHGAISGFAKDSPKSATFRYVPAAGYTGPDAFTFAANDGEADPQTTTVNIQVVERSSHAPRCQARLQTASAGASYEVESAESVFGTLTCFDADGDSLSFSVAQAPSHGSIAGLETAAAGVARFTYSADAAWTGPDSFALVAGDGVLSSDPVEVEVEVVPPVDDPPECSVSLFSERQPSGAYPAEEGEANPGVVVCDDDEGDPLTISVASAPQHGSVTGLQSEGQSAFFDYQASAGYLGPDVATLKARDPAGGEDLVTLQLQVGPAVNTAPGCTATLSAPLVDGAYHLVAGTSAAGQVSCIDSELDVLAISLVQAPSRGALSALAGSGNSRSFTYTAAAGQSGPDQFSFKANDGRTDSALAAISLLAEPPVVTPPTDNASPAPRTPVVPPPSPSQPKPKPVKCKKGFKKKMVKGKAKCVKAKHSKHKRH